VRSCTVVVPTHDRISWLRTTLRSALWQRDVDVDVIVVDDGSSDGSLEAVEALGDTRVRVLRHDAAQGVSRSRNHGAAESTGTWLAFLDDDDVWAPDKLASQIAAAETAGAEWALTGCVNVDGGLRIVSARHAPAAEAVQRTIGRANLVPGGGSNVIVRRATFERVGPFDARHRNTEDWDLWIRLAAAGPPAAVDRPLLGYRVHPGNASLDVPAIFAGADLIERTHGTRVDRGVLHRWVAESALRTGRRGEAARHLALAAVRGQGGGVARDVLAALRRRAGAEDRSAGSARRTEGQATSAWAIAAEPWLAELRG
jgi:glycosyltransferase involved in cell wall biosynthesis